MSFVSSKGNIFCRLIKIELYKIFAIINRAIKGLHCTSHYRFVWELNDTSSAASTKTLNSTTETVTKRYESRMIRQYQGICVITTNLSTPHTHLWHQWSPRNGWKSYYKSFRKFKTLAFPPCEDNWAGTRNWVSAHAQECPLWPRLSAGSSCMASDCHAREARENTAIV